MTHRDSSGTLQYFIAGYNGAKKQDRKRDG